MFKVQDIDTISKDISLDWSYKIAEAPHKFT